ncbi:MAG: hypothetical protein EHM79_21215 [Geobacter sp.]|nr:MAG: hypothetical protein EHM79_21215 [Geobacter sp.]
MDCELEDNRVYYHKAVFAPVIICIAAFFLSGSSRGEEFFKEGDYSFDARTGYHYATVDGYRGKVGEYDALDSGMETYFDLEARTRRNYLI